MESNEVQFYRGKRKKTGAWVILSVILLSIIAFAILLFYGLQKYIVIDSEGLRLEIPFLGGQSITADEPEPDKAFDEVKAELVVGEPDYSNIVATAGEGLQPIHARFVDASSLTPDFLQSCVSSMGSFDALVLEMKPASGILSYKSSVSLSKSFGSDGAYDLSEYLKALKDKGVYLVAAVSCCIDDNLAQKNPAYALRTADGQPCQGLSGAWLDPSSADVRSYTLALCKELAGMGFDEILLTNLSHPQSTDQGYIYTSTSLIKQSPVTAVSGFALNIYRGLMGEKVKLSIQAYSSTAMQAGLDSASGQNVSLFFKIFDRVYYPCERTEASSLSDIVESYFTIGEKDARFVPVCYSDAPSNGSYVARTLAVSVPADGGGDSGETPTPSPEATPTE